MTNQQTITDAYNRWESGMLTGYELSLIISSCVQDIEIEHWERDMRELLQSTQEQI